MNKTVFLLFLSFIPALTVSCRSSHLTATNEIRQVSGTEADGEWLREILTQSTQTGTSVTSDSTKMTLYGRFTEYDTTVPADSSGRYPIKKEADIGLDIVRIRREQTSDTLVCCGSTSEASAVHISASDSAEYHGITEETSEAVAAESFFSKFGNGICLSLVIVALAMAAVICGRSRY